MPDPSALPLPPAFGSPASPSPGPTFSGLAGGPQGASPAPVTPGMSQISGAAVRLGMEIDQALKLLAQTIPNLAPWVEKTVLEMRYQIGMALQSGAVPSNPASPENDRFPGGGGNL